ncbi:1-acyl-sn-glycerol-3-phosphate acyltransferase [Marinobacter fuscus]|uniref:1-acyl-sn-glycerol-3-phosphate acyltransferase n=1 Tax=Marinobacter fuscus TaxID=2109942 RepID=A0A2T1K4S8_9GAMM|nr:1-acylglycerol-3-phosphate O-acyltransferase [Marinobacter fuscus]PSF05097.1 1-acyl-sn-glycerol-3-phosphate acyltransferase [Marinobacter fuscus]
MPLIRKLLAWLSVPVLSLVMFVMYLVRPFNPDNNRVLGKLVAPTGRWLLGMKRPVYGAENMPQDRPTIIIANHQQNDDLFLMADLLPPRTVAVGKSSLVWLPFFGQVFWLGGNIILNRSRSRKAVAIMQTTSDAIIREHKSIWVFPEGTRSRGRGLGSFKKGAFHMAVAAGAPITMVCAGEYHGKSSGWSGRREAVPVRILPPVETRGLTAEDVPGLMAQCRQQMQDAIDGLALTHQTA